MKRLAVAAASVLLMLGTAQAQTRAPLYGELGYSFLEFKGDGVKTNPQAIRGIVGYEFHPNAAVEGMLMFGTKGDDFNTTEFGVPVNVDLKLRNAIGVFVKPKYNFGNIEVFGRLGWARVKVKATACAAGVCASDSDSDNDFAWGLGANYQFNPRMYAGLDWMRLNNNDGAKIQGWTVNFGYKF